MKGEQARAVFKLVNVTRTKINTGETERIIIKATISTRERERSCSRFSGELNWQCQLKIQHLREQQPAARSTCILLTGEPHRNTGGGSQGTVFIILLLAYLGPSNSLFRFLKS